MAKVDTKVVLDLHGARAVQGVDIDALETFLEHFRAALREFHRAGQAGAISRKGGRPHAREAAASAFRLVRFRTGSGIAELAPSLPRPDDELALADTGEELSMTTLRQLMAAVHEESPLPDPVWEELSSARRAMGEDGSFGVRLPQEQGRKLVIDEARLQRLRPPDVQRVDSQVRITGRLHMIEADPPNRRVGVRAQDGVDWTCSYPDRLHSLVTHLVERLVRLDGTGRRMSATTGRCQVEDLEAIPEYSHDALFADEPPSVVRLQTDQGIDGPQGLESLIGADWNDEEADNRFLEAVLGDVKPPR